jgi:hypothetical protein
MDWANESYVRMYTRETTDDLELSWEALSLWRALLCKFDRSGLIAAKNGWVSVAKATRFPIEVTERAGAELVADGRVKLVRTGIFAPNFTAAQTASKSDKVRQRESRDRRREQAAGVQDAESSTDSATVSQSVTDSHAASRNVTLALAIADPKPVPIPSDDRSATTAIPEVLSEKLVRATRSRRQMPSGWQPARIPANEAAESEAKARGVDLRLELMKIRDWAIAQNAVKADWDATWRNWLRNAKVAYADRPEQAPRQIKRLA